MLFLSHNDQDFSIFVVILLDNVFIVVRGVDLIRHKLVDECLKFNFKKMVII